MMLNLCALIKENEFARFLSDGASITLITISSSYSLNIN